MRFFRATLGVECVALFILIAMIVSAVPMANLKSKLIKYFMLKQLNRSVFVIVPVPFPVVVKRNKKGVPGNEFESQDQMPFLQDNFNEYSSMQSFNGFRPLPLLQGTSNPMNQGIFNDVPNRPFMSLMLQNTNGGENYNFPAYKDQQSIGSAKVIGREMTGRLQENINNKMQMLFMMGRELTPPKNTVGMKEIEHMPQSSSLMRKLSHFH